MSLSKRNLFEKSAFCIFWGELFLSVMMYLVSLTGAFGYVEAEPTDATASKIIELTYIYATLVIISMALFSAYFITRKHITNEMKRSLVALSMFSFILSVWLYSEYSMFTLVLENIITVRIVSFISFLLLPAPLILYITNRCQILRSVLSVLVLVHELFAAVNVALLVLNGFEFPDTLKIYHLIILASAVVCMAVCVYEGFRNKNKSTHSILLGFVIFLISGVASIILYYAGNDYYMRALLIGVFGAILSISVNDILSTAGYITALQKIKQISAETPVDIFQCKPDRELSFIYTNEHFNMLASQEIGMTGNGLICYIHPEDRESFYTQVNENHEKGITFFGVEARLQVKPAEYSWMLFKCKVSLTRDYITITAVSIQAHKKLSESLFSERDKFNAIFNFVPVGIRYYDFATRELLQNKNSEKLNGFGSVIPGVPEFFAERDYIEKESLKEYLAMYDKIRAGARYSEGIFRINTGDRNIYRYIHVSYTTLVNKDGTAYGAVGVSEDVTSQLEKEMEYSRKSRAMSGYSPENTTTVEWNLTDDKPRKTTGNLLAERGCRIFGENETLDANISAFTESFVHTLDKNTFTGLINRERLLGMYHSRKYSDELEFRLVGSDGDYIWLRVSFQLVCYPATDDVIVYLVFDNINDQKLNEIALVSRAELDTLTGVYNRSSFREKLEKLLDGEGKEETHAIFMLDADGFKSVNDVYGHDAGDRLLVNLSKKIKSNMRRDDIVGRIGGDEFIICIKNIPFEAAIVNRAQLILDSLNTKIDDELTVSFSIGIAVYPRDGKNADELYKNADTALYYAKRNGKNTFSVYNEKMNLNAGLSSVAKPADKLFYVSPVEEKRSEFENGVAGAYKTIFAKDCEGLCAQLLKHSVGIGAIIISDNFTLQETEGIIGFIRSEKKYTEYPIIVITDKEEQQLELIKAGATDTLCLPVDYRLLIAKVNGAILRSENERVRIQRGYRQYQSTQEEKYREVLLATGTLVSIYDTLNSVFTIDPLINTYIAGRFDSRPVATVIREDGVADKENASVLEDCVYSVISKNKDKNETTVKLKTPSGDFRWFLVQVIRMRNRDESSDKILITLNDVNEKYEIEKQLKYRAERDMLTGLYNRMTFFALAEEMIKSKPAGSYIMYCFDINNFKLINDRFSHSEGDRLLKLIAGLTEKSTKAMGGICCRISADIFAGIFESVYREEADAKINFNDDIREAGFNHSITLSSGRYVINDITETASKMFDKAAIAKAGIKGRYDQMMAYYDEVMIEEIVRNQEIMDMMGEALISGQYLVYLQPQYNHSTGMLIGAEALVRWKHPTKGLIQPGVFIPVFEKCGFIYSLDRYVWETVCKLLRKWIDLQWQCVPVSVNVSRYDITRSDFIDVICGLADSYEIPTGLLRLEITETAFAESTELVINTVKQLKERGFVIEIDDFGHGYSSLNTLKDVPADILKLDMRFLEESDDTHRGGSIISSVVRMAKWLDMPVIAEGVEDLEQADFLKSIGCVYIQGYLYAKPMAVSEFERILKSERTDIRLSQLSSLMNVDSKAFWNPQSLETLVFNTYVGGACVLEYHNGCTEILRVNSKFLETIGTSLTEIEIINDNPFCRLSYEDATVFRYSLDYAVETGEEVAFEAVIGSGDGCNGEKHIKTSCRVVVTNGDYSLIYCAIYDVSAKYEAQKECIDTQKALDAVIKKTGAAIGVFELYDGTLRVKNASPELLGYLGYDKDGTGFIGRDIRLAEAAGKTEAENIRILTDSSTGNDNTIKLGISLPSCAGEPLPVNAYATVISKKTLYDNNRIGHDKSVLLIRLI